MHVRLDGRVVMQRPAKPFTPVRFRIQPPIDKLLMNKKYVIVSGGFDPIHSGHIELIKNAAEYGNVIVIVNDDKFLIDKKGYVFMSSKERIGIIKNLKNVYEVILSIDSDHTVSKTIQSIADKYGKNTLYFANGGDRKTTQDIPEEKVCSENNIELLFDIGGDKTQSSSSLVEDVHDQMLNKKGNFQIVTKPWGYFKSFINENSYLLKKIVINPNEELSLQSHKHREEHWVVVSGSIEAELNGEVKLLKVKDFISIPRSSNHRIINKSKSKAVIIEIQFGNILHEKDIKRFEDKYDRD